MDLVEGLHYELLSAVSRVVLIGRRLERLADGFFGVFRETAAGYVIVVPRNSAKGVSS